MTPDEALTSALALNADSLVAPLLLVCGLFLFATSFTVVLATFGRKWLARSSENQVTPWTVIGIIGTVMGLIMAAVGASTVVSPEEKLAEVNSALTQFAAREDLKVLGQTRLYQSDGTEVYTLPVLDPDGVSFTLTLTHSSGATTIKLVH